jgi:hypothetical protein
MTTTETEIRTSAEEMRTAATRLRDLAKDITTTEGGWSGFHVEDDGRATIYGGPLDEAGYRTGTVFEFKDYDDCEECTRPTGPEVSWMFIVNPLLAEPLAAWLDSAANDTETIGTDFRALKVARTINGTEA